MSTQSIPVRKAATVSGRGGLLDKYFYFFMSLLIAVVVVYGFSHTIDSDLLHATPTRPWILWLHAAVFSGWVVFFILQSALVRTHHVRVHRTLGWFGAGLGAAIPALGTYTAIVMARFFTALRHSIGPAAFLTVDFTDMACFIVPFALAVLWRKKPEYHRRLALVASCALTAAAFGRFPHFLVPHYWFYAGVDVLILLGVIHDLIVNRRVHRVYLYTLPLFLAAQSVAMYLFLSRSPWWLKIADKILG